MAYGYDLKTGLPPGGRPVLRLHIFDIFDIFNILTYNLGGCSDSTYFFVYLTYQSYRKGGVEYRKGGGCRFVIFFCISVILTIFVILNISIILVIFVI